MWTKEEKLLVNELTMPTTQKIAALASSYQSHIELLNKTISEIEKLKQSKINTLCDLVIEIASEVPNLSDTLNSLPKKAKTPIGLFIIEVSNNRVA